MQLNIISGHLQSGQRVLALVHERPRITMAEIRDKFGLSGAGVARGPRRLLDRGALREEPLPGGDIGFRIGDGE